jgi:hypothetical protein
VFLQTNKKNPFSDTSVVSTAIAAGAGLLPSLFALLWSFFIRRLLYAF